MSARIQIEHRARPGILPGGKFSLDLSSPLAFQGDHDIAEIDEHFFEKLVQFEASKYLSGVAVDFLADDFLFSFIDGTNKSLINCASESSLSFNSVGDDDCSLISDITDSTADLSAVSVSSVISRASYRKEAISRWRAKKANCSGRRKVCEARSRVANNRPRVQGKFVPKALWVSITQLSHQDPEFNSNIQWC